MIIHKSFWQILTSVIILSFCIADNLLGFDVKDKPFDKIFNLIYNQQFNEAQEELILAKKELDELNYDILMFDLYWWKAISSNRENDFDELESILKKYSDDLKNKPNLYKLEELIYLSYSLRFSFLKRRFLSSIANIYMINQITEQLEIEKLTIEQRNIFEIYLALINICKSRVFFYDPQLRLESIHILESNITSSNPVYQTISCYFLSKIYFELDKSPSKSRIYCEMLCKNYPGNKVFIHNLELCKNINDSEIEKFVLN